MQLCTIHLSVQHCFVCKASTGEIPCYTLLGKLNSHLNSLDVAQLSGRSTSLVQSVVLCNYKRGGHGLWGLLLDFTRKVPEHYMNFPEEIHPAFVYWAVKKLNEKSF